MDNEFRRFTVKGLKNLAKLRGIRGYSGLRRAQLIERLSNQEAPLLDRAPILTPTMDNEFRRLTLKDIKNLAKLRGIRGYSGLRRAQLIERLSNQGTPILDRDIGNIRAPILTPTPYVPLPPATPPATPPPAAQVEEILESLESVQVPKSISPELKALKEKINKIYRKQEQIVINQGPTAHREQARQYIANGIPVSSPGEFLSLARPGMTNILKVNRGRKVKMALECYMYIISEGPNNAKPARFSSHVNEINSKETDVYELYDNMVNRILENIATFQRRDSGWLFLSVIELVLHTAVYDPLKAGGYIPLPAWIANKKVVINMKNEDNKYFLWCILRALNPVNNKAQRVDKVLKRKENSLNMNGIKHPVSFKDIDKFEKQNPEISVNVFEYTEDMKINRIRAIKKLGSNHVNLLFINEGERTHYALIKNFRGLMREQVTDNGGIEYCMLCLNHFGSKERTCNTAMSMNLLL